MAPKAKATTEASKSHEIPALETQEFLLTIVGDSPLIVHAWSEKAKKEMLDKQMQIATLGKQPKDPVQDFLTSMYHYPTGRTITEENLVRDGAEFGIVGPTVNCETGFPAIGVKASAVTAAVDAGMFKTEARRAFHINAEYVKIDGRPSMREDMVRIGQGTADLRYRAEYKNWRITFKITHNKRSMSAGQIANLFNLAGFGVGIGEWRSEKDGDYGRFHVLTNAGETETENEQEEVAVTA